MFFYLLQEWQIEKIENYKAVSDKKAFRCSFTVQFNSQYRYLGVYCSCTVLALRGFLGEFAKRSSNIRALLDILRDITYKKSVIWMESTNLFVLVELWNGV